MNYEGLKERILQKPLDFDERWTVEYLREIFEFHLNSTPYWESAGRGIDLNGIFKGSLTEVFEGIFNAGLAVEEDYLRSHWLEFVPRHYQGRIRFYQSSGTTRERAIGHWDYEYLSLLTAYLKSAMDEIYHLDKTYNGEHRMRALAHGPYGWYQDEISKLVWDYSGVLYFIGMESDGLKRIYAQEGLEAVLKVLDPLVRYTTRVMEADSINVVRSAPPLMKLFEPYAEGIETAIVSGVGVDSGLMEYLSSRFGDTQLIPLYGYYLFGDLIGIQRKREFWYYPNYPTTIIFPVVVEEGRYRIARYGERGRTAMVIARPEVLMVKVEGETATRVPGEGPFKWDGFAEPRRGTG